MTRMSRFSSGLVLVGVVLASSGCVTEPTSEDPAGLLPEEVAEQGRLADLREPSRDRLFHELDNRMRTWRLLSADVEGQASMAALLCEYVEANRSAIITALSSGVVRERCIASAALFFNRDLVVVDALVERLSDESTEVIGNALMALSVTADKRVPTDRILELARSTDTILRRNAVLVLGRLADRDLSAPAVDGLLLAAGDPDPAVRFNAVKGLGKARVPRSVAVLLPLLRDPWPRIRAHAALSLAAVGNPVAVAPVAELLGDDSALVRQAARSAVDALNSASEREIQP